VHTMNDDAYSLFIVIACMVILAMPSTPAK
jgi:hypothetical protein